MEASLAKVKGRTYAMDPALGYHRHVDGPAPEQAD
jgi:hypothetical protein